MTIASKISSTLSESLSNFKFGANLIITETKDSVTLSVSRDFLGSGRLRIVAEKNDFDKDWTVVLEIPSVHICCPKAAVCMANDMLFLSQALANAKADIKGYIG